MYMIVVKIYRVLQST